MDGPARDAVRGDVQSTALSACFDILVSSLIQGGSSLNDEYCSCLLMLLLVGGAVPTSQCCLLFYPREASSPSAYLAPLQVSMSTQVPSLTVTGQHFEIHMYRRI